MVKITKTTALLIVLQIIFLAHGVSWNDNETSYVTITAEFDEQLGVIIFNGKTYSEQPLPLSNCLEEDDEKDKKLKIPSKPKILPPLTKPAEPKMKIKNQIKIRGFGRNNKSGVLNSVLKYYIKFEGLILDPIYDMFEIPEFCFVIASIFIIFAALMSGLTASYLSISWTDLQFKIQNGTDEEKEMAAEVLNIVKDRHTLIVTMLFTNELLMEAISYWLEVLLPGFFTLILTILTTLVLEEFVPKAFLRCFPKLRATALLSPVVKYLRFGLGFLVYPTALFLTLLIKSLNCRLRAEDSVANADLILRIHKKSPKSDNKSEDSKPSRFEEDKQCDIKPRAFYKPPKRNSFDDEDEYWGSSDKSSSDEMDSDMPRTFRKRRRYSRRL